MMRSLMAGLAVLAIFACTVRADDEPKQVQGKVAKFDPAQRILKVKVGEREVTYKVRQNTEFVDQNDRQIPEQAQVEQVAPGAQVVLVLVDQGAAQGPQQVSKVKIKVVRIKKKTDTEQNPPDRTKPKPKTKPDQNTEPDQAPEQTPPSKPKVKEKPDQSPNQSPPKPKTKPEPAPDQDKDKE